MTNLFSSLQKAAEEQEQTLQRGTPLPMKAETASERDAQNIAQKPAQVSKPLSKSVNKSLNKGLSHHLSQDAIEELAFRLRKTPQSKINANVPLEWREKIDALAFQLKVGKYELLTYIVGVFLGEVEQPQS
ncbi:MAG: hypothetical protein K8L97_20610 [Anaerolineae bacterium]|nr:hypothetical protein [Anaerolineae bacterium]